MFLQLDLQWQAYASMLLRKERPNTPESKVCTFICKGVQQKPKPLCLIASHSPSTPQDVIVECSEAGMEPPAASHTQRTRGVTKCESQYYISRMCKQTPRLQLHLQRKHTALLANGKDEGNVASNPVCFMQLATCCLQCRSDQKVAQQRLWNILNLAYLGEL